ncbi:prolipoprotein LppL [Corynebacterium jeikeium]|nr:prolipoprotein LppL [Corynebacterium jeikeium]
MAGLVALELVNVHVNRFSRTLCVTATAALALGALTACGSDDPVDNAPVAGEPAQPQDSPDSSSGLGEQIKLDAPTLGAARIGLSADENAPGANQVAILTKGKVHFIDATSPKDEPRQVDVDDSCDNISTTATGVAVACQDKAIELGPDGKEIRSLDVDGKVTTVTFLDNGKAVLGKAGEDKARFYDKDGNETGDAIVSRSLDEAVLVNPHGRGQRVALIDRGQTSINDVNVDDGSLNASLRIGQGVGQVATGRGDDGVLVASDARQNQMLIYTMNDVVRLHQAIPTKASPWGVAWDAKRQLAWVGSTEENKLTSFRIDSGAPMKVAEIEAPSKVREVMDVASGALVLVTEDGKVNVYSAQSVDDAVKDKQTTPDEEYPVKKG